MMRTLLLAAAAGAAIAASAPQYDVLVYGATPGGIQTALAAAGEGASVLLVHPLKHVGGMMTGGLGMTDAGNKSVIGGAALSFFRSVGKAYSGGSNDNPVYVFEPHVAECVFNALIAAAAPKLTLLTQQTLVAATKAGGVITSASFAPTAAAEAVAHPSALPASTLATYTARLFVDGSYEGDLLAAANVTFANGREGKAVYNESLAGRLTVPNSVGGHQFHVAVDPYWSNGTLLPLIFGGDPGTPGQGDDKQMAYNFRMCFRTDGNANKTLPLPKPAGYDPAQWELLRRWVAAANLTSIHDMMNISPVPNEKTDTNNNNAISTDVIGASWGWAEATPAGRKALWQLHYDYTAGFLWTLANDPAMPASIRTQMSRIGLAADEFTDNGGWPWQLYVREGRRMIGQYVFTQNDRTTTKAKPDSIGLFSYNIDTHNSQRFVQMEGGVAWVRNEGDVEAFSDLGPGQMPYRMITPLRADATNLLAPVPASASHMGFGTIRLEPQWMILGQSAGVAAAQALADGVAVQDLDVPKLQARLRALGQIIDM